MIYKCPVQLSIQTLCLVTKIMAMEAVWYSIAYNVQWYLGIRPLWNKSKLVYVLFAREKFCLVYDLCLEDDLRVSK
jgi:hypothetical protein